MLFVNAEKSPERKYGNVFLEGGRKLVWFPSAGQTRQHPLIKRMLNANELMQHQNSQKDQVTFPLDNSPVFLSTIKDIRISE